MSGEHEDHDDENHDREPRTAAAERTGLPDDESGPRASTHPVLDDTSSDPFADDDEAAGPSAHRSASPPRPRLKDSKYPPPTAAAPAEAGAAPAPRKKVISSPDLPPARARTTPPPEAGSDPEIITGPVVPRAPARPHDMHGDSAPRPPVVPPPRQRMATLREESDDDIAAAPRPSDGRVILPPAGKATGPATARAAEPPAPSVKMAEPASPPAPRVIVPSAGSAPPGPASTPSSRVLSPPPKPERRDEYVATYSRTPSLKPPPLPPSAERSTPPSAAAAAAPTSVAAAPAPAATPAAGAPPATTQQVAAPTAATAPGVTAAATPRAAPPSAAPTEPTPATMPTVPRPATSTAAPTPAATAQAMPAGSASTGAQAAATPPMTPPPPAVRPSSGAATSYPPPSNPPPAVKTDSIAVHAIRVINIGVDDTVPPAPPAPLAHADAEDFENIEDYTEEFEPPPDSLDEADVEALTDDEPAPPKPPAPPAEGAPPSSAPVSSDVKLPPPPKRQAPSPPKKKGPRAPARKRRPWWEEVFSEDFARATHHLSSRHIKREVDFIDSSLGVAQGAVVLDLACGTGEHSIELASRGYSVVGYDLSVYQLAIAGESAQERELKINFLQGDMREMAFQEMFDGIFCWNTSFGYFEEEKNVAVAERIFQALRPGGMFLIDVVNRDHVMQHQPSQVWFQGDACVCMDDMSVDYITSRLRVKRSIIMDDGRTRECFYSIRLYTLHELGKLLHGVGFRVVEASGHPTTPGVYLGPNSPRVIILAQRP